MFLLKVPKGDALDSRFHNAEMTIPRIVLSWCSSIPESFMPLVDDGHTAWLIISELLINFNIYTDDFPMHTQNLITVTAQLNVTGCHITFWHF